MFESIKLLQSKLRSAIKSRSKNVNLTIDEASMLLTEINAIIISKSESDKNNRFTPKCIGGKNRI